MLSGMKKLKIAMAIGTLLMFAVGVGCNGFFVDPTLTSLAVGPQASIQQGKTVQMTAVGTYNDGTQNTVKSVQWSTSDSGIATVSAGGLVTGVAPGSATITGASGAVNGSTTITVTLSGLSKITISPSSASITEGSQQQYKAIGTAQGQ